MWTLDKPELSRAKGKDVRELIANSDDLDESIKKPLRDLYQQYDDQQGRVTDVQLGTIAADKSEAIYRMYKSTYENRPLAYIRDELTAKVYKCPYCGIAQPNTLDHYMPESKYKALSVCRMNLVPMCGVCNNYKNAKPYTNFIHCYYESLPTTRPFLVAKVHTVKQRFVVRFDFDSTAIADANLEHRLRYQEKEIRLFKRLKKESVVFINTLCRSCEAVDTPALKIWLGRRLDDYECMHKKNDWRCAVIRGLIAYPGLDITLIQYNRANPVCVNAGGA